jgi:lipopolysaccharide export system permease protein
LSTLDRYVLREVLQAWLAVTSLLLLILVGNELAQILGQAAERGYPREIIFALIGLTSIQNLSVLIPVGLLLGIVLALGRLYHDSEMAAIQACGVGPARLLRPIGLVALVVSGLLGWISLSGAPQAFGRAQDIKREALRGAEFGMLEPGRFHSFAGGSAVFYADSADPDGTLRHVFIQRRFKDRVEVVLADRARHVVEEAGSLHTLILYDGERYELGVGSPVSRRIHFAEHGIPVRVGDRDNGPPRIETRQTLDLFADPGLAAQAEFQWRLSLPLMALILALIAVPLAELQPRQGRYARLGVVILTFFIYVNVLSAARTWIEKGWVAPGLGLWWVHGMVLLAAALLWSRQLPRIRVGS